MPRLLLSLPAAGFTLVVALSAVVALGFWKLGLVAALAQ